MTAHSVGATSRMKKLSRPRRVGILLMLTLSLLPLSTVRAQQPSPPAAGQDVPTLTPRMTAPVLADHRFTTTALVRGPFITTYFRNSIAVGMAPGSEIPLAVIDGEEIVFETGDLLFSTLVLEYQQGVKDWMGFWVNFGLAGRLGTETASLLSQGVTVASGFRVGWLLRIMQSKDMTLSGTVQIDKDDYTAVDLVGFVDGIIDDGLTEDDQLVSNASLMVAKTGLSYAWAINRTTGLTASGTVGYGESPDRATGSDWYFDAGAAVDFDLRREIPVPIGVAVGVRSTSFSQADLNLGDNLTSAAFRVDYIGRHDLNIGLEIQSQWQDLEGSDRLLRFTIAAMDFRYYF